MKLISRCVVLVLCALLCLFRPEDLTILEGSNFFSRFSVLHLLWAVWMFSMLCQLFPIDKKLPLGSMKHFSFRFKPAGGDAPAALLSRNYRQSGKRALIVLGLWIALIAVIGLLYYRKLINNAILFMISAAFYVCDLICVLIWCPFRLMLGNRCCTTCRIFNWDHMMMFTPMMFIDGFYSRSLLFVALADWLYWEICLLRHPERFFPQTNESLRCSSCTDKLCTHICQRKSNKNKPV